MSKAPTSLNEARNEMRRLMNVLTKSERDYLKREAEVTEMHRQGQQNYTGDLITVLGNDLPLRMYSGTSKTVAVLISGVSAYIQAEIAMKQWRRQDPGAAQAFEMVIQKWRNSESAS